MTPTPARRASAEAQPLLGEWVQDDTGSNVTYRRNLHFNSDATYQLTTTSRDTGSSNESVIATERGDFDANADTLTFRPSTGSPRTVRWRVDRDPYVGDERLVMDRPDGVSDVYYRP